MMVIVVAMDFLHFLIALLSLAYGGAFSVFTVEALVGAHLAVVGGATVEVDATENLTCPL